jgi:hypothetical protein
VMSSWQIGGPVISHESECQLQLEAKWLGSYVWVVPETRA